MVGALPESVPEPANVINWTLLISSIVTVIAGLGGVWIGALLTSKQQKEQRKLAFIEKQLRYFYSPLLGIRKEIQMLSELQNKISKSADENWRKMCADARERSGDDVRSLRDEIDARKDEFMGIIKYSNRQLTERLLPSYRRMVSIFREYYYLADSSTCKHFCPLIEFVDIWDRYLDKSIPHEVGSDLGHSENTLNLFYKEIEELHDKLRMKLNNGKA